MGDKTVREKLVELLFPSAVQEYEVDFARENYRTLKILIYGGLALSVLFSYCVFVVIGGTGFGIRVTALEYLVFFGAGACVFYNIKLKEIRHGTPCLYVFLGALIVFSAFISRGNAEGSGALAPFFLVLLTALVVWDSFGRVLIVSASFSLFLVIFFCVTTSGDGRTLNLFRLFIVFLMAAFVSHRHLSKEIGFMVSSETATNKAEHDALTGIYNRRGGEQLIAELAGKGSTGAFFILDVDDFKHINDSYGHAAGDNALICVAETLRKSFRESDVVMRMGGDEFIVYAQGLADMHNVENKLEALRAALHEIVIDEASGDHVTASIGCIVNLGSYTSYDALYAAADELLYKVKSDGKDSFKCSDKEMKAEDKTNITAW